MYGDVQPGDIKYKDVNGDGVVDDGDIVAIGATNRPNLIYGVGLSAMWRGFDFNVLFQGAGKATVSMEGKAVWAFSQDRYGQIFDDLVKDRWVDRETAAILGIPANENPNASYPRMVLLESNATHNNYRSSTFWTRDCSYLRLKTLRSVILFRKISLQISISRMHVSSYRQPISSHSPTSKSGIRKWAAAMVRNIL